jgi:protoporphyrin/coproporphyrin ferrochelatase
LLRKPFAAMIAQFRHKKVAGHYDLIGGKSPLLDWTNAQKAVIERQLSSGRDAVTCFVGMRYFKPFIKDAVSEAYQAGYRNFCFLPMYPQYCRATTGSSFEETGRALAGLAGVTTSFVKDYHDHPGYVALLRSYIETGLKPGDTLLFSAHSIPVSFVEQGDPYVDQVKRTVELVAGNREHYLSFQSRTGPVSWVGPDTISEAKRLLKTKPGNLLIVPISFVCDHIETLYEIDIELKELLGPELGARVKRTPMFNDDPRFGQLLAEIVQERIIRRG